MSSPPPRSRAPCWGLSFPYMVGGLSLRPPSSLLPSLLPLQEASRALRGQDLELTKLGGGWKEREARPREGGGDGAIGRDWVPPVACKCWLRGGGAGGPPGASGTGLAVPAETLTGRGVMAMVPWGDLLRSLRRRSKDSTIPATSQTAESAPPTVGILSASKSGPPFLDHSLPSLTGHLHDVPGDNVPSLYPLH